MSSDAEVLGAQPAGNGALDGAEEDPAAAFLAQQENEIAGIESDEGYGILDSGDVPPALQAADGFAAGTARGRAAPQGLRQGPAATFVPGGRRRGAACPWGLGTALRSRLSRRVWGMGAGGWVVKGLAVLVRLP